MPLARALDVRNSVVVCFDVVVAVHAAFLFRCTLCAPHHVLLKLEQFRFFG